MTTAGHKSTECYNRSGHQSAAQPAVTQSWGADHAGYDWQPSGPSAEQVFSALEWHQDRQPEAHQNTRATWLKIGGYGKGHGATWYDKGGGKSGGWFKGGRGK